MNYHLSFEPETLARAGQGAYSVRRAKCEYGLIRGALISRNALKEKMQGGVSQCHNIFFWAHVHMREETER